MGTEETEPASPAVPEPTLSTASEPTSSATLQASASAMPEPTQLASAEPTASKKKVVLTEHGATAKIRNPWLVALFCVITLGIYYLFWYYFVNREMADYGEAHKTDIGASPGMSVVAITIGGLIIVPPFVSVFHTGKRMRLSRRVAGIPGGSAGLFFLLSIIPIVSFFAPAYLQSELNGAWRTLPAAQL
jgi:Domain of unknown function (DUF4234)